MTKLDRIEVENEVIIPHGVKKFFRLRTSVSFALGCGFMIMLYSLLHDQNKWAVVWDVFWLMLALLIILSLIVAEWESDK